MSQGNPKAVRVKDVGESECRAVMVRIRIETSVDAKAGRLPTGLSSWEPSGNRLRQRQKTVDFRKEYGRLSGIEGTLSQGVRCCGLRRSRYIGEAKTHLHNLMIATSLNLMRMIAWVMEVPLAKTRVSP